MDKNRINDTLKSLICRTQVATGPSVYLHVQDAEPIPVFLRAIELGMLDELEAYATTWITHLIETESDA